MTVTRPCFGNLPLLPQTSPLITGCYKRKYFKNLNIDSFSQDVLVSQIELWLNYSTRFYNRQFITRKAVNHNIIASLEKLLNDYFEREDSIDYGLPSVTYICSELKLSQRYLSDMLRSLTGLNTQQYIQTAIIEKAKEKLSTTNLTVSEIAYELGFEHSQSFSKLFKKKTDISPLEFRQSFNWQSRKAQYLAKYCAN